MSSGAIARFCLATVLSGVALFVLFIVWAGVGYSLNESGTTVAFLFVGGILLAMVLSVVGIFALLWFRPNRRRQAIRGASVGESGIEPVIPSL